MGIEIRTEVPLGEVSSTLSDAPMERDSRSDISRP